MNAQELELTLDQWVRSKWFGYLYKIASIAGAVIITVGGSVASWAIFDTRQSAASAVTAVADMRLLQERRAAVSDVTQQLETRDRAALIEDVKDIQKTVLAQQNDIGEIKGLLRQLATQDVAATHPTAFIASD